MSKKTTRKAEIQPNFSIIIPNYNGASFISDCLNSLFKAIQNCPESEFEIIIVDNGSKDQSLDLAKKITNKFTKYQTRYLRFNKNKGFSTAINSGINQSKYSYVVVLNNDLTIEKNWFKLVAQVITKNTDSKISTFFGTVLTKDGTKFESQGLDFKIEGKCLNISNNQPFSPTKLDKDSSNKIIWGAPASLVIYQKDIIKKVGLFDEDFFAYEEDVDLSFRLNKLGYKTKYLPKAISYHLGGGTSNQMGNFRARMDTKNWLYLIIKYYSLKEITQNIIGITSQRLRNLIYLIRETITQSHFLSIYKIPIDLIKTYGEVIIKTPKMLKKRQQFKKLLKYSNL